MRQHDQHKPHAEPTAEAAAAEPAGDHAHIATHGALPPPKAEAATAHHASASDQAFGHHVKGGADNVDLTHINNHPGFDHNRLGDKHHHGFHTTTSSLSFNSDGKPAKEIPAHVEAFINAGAITELVCHDPARPDSAKPQSCVYVFGYRHAHDKSGAMHSLGAWVPAHVFPHIVAQEQHAIAQRIENERDDNHQHFGRGVEIVSNASPEHDGVQDLYTYPNQDTVANKAKYYYGNLALNIPYTGGERVGVLDANIPQADPEVHGLDPYREFYAEQPHREVSIPLYAERSHHPSGKHLRFVYGFVKNDAGEKIYGWINKSMLPRHG